MRKAKLVMFFYPRHAIN